MRSCIACTIADSRILRVLLWVEGKMKNLLIYLTVCLVAWRGVDGSYDPVYGSNPTVFYNRKSKRCTCSYTRRSVVVRPI